jgi:hypothetical protein
MMSVQYAQAQNHASSARPGNANPDWRPQQQPMNKTEVQSAPRPNNQFTLACLPPRYKQPVRLFFLELKPHKSRITSTS